VYEVSGGGWRQEGAAWVSDAYAYNLSISCNHCEQPVCVEACPTTALYKRPDGLVLIDPQRCIGCKYCTWACPYGAPQYDPDYRVMTKCTGCDDYLEAGLPPACVAACPLRVLDFGDTQAMQARYSVNDTGLVQSVAPLPEKGLTLPGLLIRPHRDVQRAAQGQPRLANLEEVHTAPPQDERPLMLFTVLAQMAVGAFITLGLFEMPYYAPDSTLPALVVFMIMATALLVSLMHLGQPQRAYRAIANWRTSWLSWEILSAGAFTCGVALFNLLQWFYPSLQLTMGGGAFWVGLFSLHSIVFYLTVLAGLMLLYSISRVFHLRTVPVWNNRRTIATFFATAFLLGPLLANFMLLLERRPYAIFNFVSGDDSALFKLILCSAWIALIATILQGWLTWQDHAENAQPDTVCNRLRLGMLIACALATILILVQLVQGGHPKNWINIGIALAMGLGFALVSELLGRWMFYEKKGQTGL
jgi:anaerobic dimethyl sulfoxide reductase subunit B